MPEIGETAKKIIGDGSVKVKVTRSGMHQLMTFTVKRVKHADVEFVELFIPRLIDMGELLRVAKETGLPVEAENGRAFPEGKGAGDFVGL